MNSCSLGSGVVLLFLLLLRLFLALVCSPLRVLAHLDFFNRGNVSTVGSRSLHLIRGCGRWRFGLAEVATTPAATEARPVVAERMSVLDLLLGRVVDFLLFVSNDLLGLVLCSHCLVVANVLVVLLGLLVKLTWPLVSRLAHLLSHDLRESTVGTAVVKGSLGFGCLHLLGLLLKQSQVGFAQGALGQGLPANSVELVELVPCGEQLFAACREQVQEVVHLDSVPEDSGHESLAIRSPLDTNRA